MSRKLQLDCLVLAFIVGLGMFPSARSVLTKDSSQLGRIYSIQLPKTVMGAAISPDGHRLAVEMSWGVVTPRGDVSQGIDELQLWDVDNQKEIAKAELASRPNWVPGKPVGCFYRFTRFSSDRTEILVCDGRILQLLDAHTLALLGIIDLHLPVLPASTHSNLAVDEMELAPNGKRVALTLSDNQSGSVRIYDLATCTLALEWKYEGINVGLGGAGLTCTGVHCREDLAGPEWGGFTQIGPAFYFFEGLAGSGGSCQGGGVDADAGIEIGGGGFKCNTTIGSSIGGTN